MELDLSYLCTVIGSLTGVPVRVYENGKPVFFYSLVSLPKDPVRAYEGRIEQITDRVGYCATDRYSYYGIVNAKNCRIVIGPSGQTRPSDRELRELAFRADVPPDEVSDFVSGMKAVACLPLESILQILCVLNYLLNGERKTLEDIAIYDEEQEELRVKQSKKNAEARFSEQSALPERHDTYDLEQRLMNLIRKGETAALRDWVSAAPAVRGGLLAPDQLRQMKNTFIVTATLASRSAIRG
ncbi:MAG: hypothetical protein J5843_03215, partial [Clostridia bacterium]|nr:hypothetical protein [Clostridia bacterium]